MCGIVIQGDLFTKINFLKCSLILDFKVFTDPSKIGLKVTNMEFLKMFIANMD